MAKDEDKKELPEDHEESADVEVVVEGEAAPTQQAEAKDDKIRAGGDDGVEVDEGETDEEREAIRERRRQEKAERRQRAKERDEAKDREIAYLKAQLEGVSQNIGAINQRTAASDLRTVENEIMRARQEIAEAEEIIKLGVAEQKGDAVAAANRAMLESARRHDQLMAYRENMVRSAQQQQAPKVDPLVVQHAQSWIAKNTWYDPNGKDPDSRVALAIDEALSNEGWNPRDPKYWEEFDKRVTKYIPHRRQQAQGTDDEDEPTGSPTSGSGRERSAPTGAAKTKYTVSQARVAALKEAGQWEDFQSDAKFRARMIARFKEADTRAKG